MGRFYFHLRSGKNVLVDEEGSDLPDVAAARLEALATARFILADAIRSGTENLPEAFVIADSDGRELETVPLDLVLPRQFKHQPNGSGLPWAARFLPPYKSVWRRLLTPRNGLANDA